MTKAIWNVLILFVMTVTILGCSGDEDKKSSDSKSGINGTIEKGPFLTGSKVTLYELDKKLNQTGKSFKTETINDKGDFVFPKVELSSQYVEFEINGYFYNEVTGRRSNSQINLNAITDVSSQEKVNVNILTHLEFKRVKTLMAEGKDFSSAKKEAEMELLKVFYITKGFKNPEKISLTDGDDNAAMLLAISSILLCDKSEGEFSEFIAKLSNEFADKGTVSSQALLEGLFLGAKMVNAQSVMNNLSLYYKEQGTDVTINNIRKYIDGNGDGVLDAKDEVIDGGEIPPVELPGSELEKKFKDALTDVYASVREYFQRIIVLDAVRCKQATVPTIQINPYDQAIRDAWNCAYKTIRQLHVIMEAADRSISTSGFDVKPYLNASRVLRSLIYLDMVQHWGGVPLITRTLDVSEDLNIPRNSKEEVLAFIQEEMGNILSDLPEKGSDDGLIPSRMIAAVTLANAQLENADYVKASEQLVTISNDESYVLLGNNSDIYQIKSKEDIFSIEYTAGQSIPSSFVEVIKHAGDVHPIHRFTGVVLNCAGALYQSDPDAVSPKVLVLINRVRRSLGKSDLSGREVTLEEIANLWKEAIGKDYGYFSLLKRLDLAVSTLNIEQYETLYPIPRHELDSNSAMVQNPGYN